MNYYNISNQSDYDQAYQKSVDDPNGFWDKIASDNFVWKQTWESVCEHNFKEAKFTWFKGAKLNITENCIDRHLATRSEQTAIIF